MEGGREERRERDRERERERENRKAEEKVKKMEREGLVRKREKDQKYWTDCIQRDGRQDRETDETDITATERN